MKRAAYIVDHLADRVFALGARRLAHALDFLADGLFAWSARRAQE